MPIIQRPVLCGVSNWLLRHDKERWDISLQIKKVLWKATADAHR